MRHALLVLLLAIANGGQPPGAPETQPAAAPGAVAAMPAALTGSWAGEWAEPGAPAPIGLEASFTTATRKVIAYFTFIENGVRRTVLRQGVPAADGLRFAWPGGRRLDLRFTASDRLEGDIVTPGDGAAGVRTGAVSLSRRPR
jgi:hypothetical protein